jgi:hypothetical protein
MRICNETREREREFGVFIEINIFFYFSLKKMIYFCSLIDAQNGLVNDFIIFFQHLHQIFGNEFFKIKIIPMFDSIIKSEGKRKEYREENLSLNPI